LSYSNVNIEVKKYTLTNTNSLLRLVPSHPHNNALWNMLAIRILWKKMFCIKSCQAQHMLKKLVQVSLHAFLHKFFFL